MATGSTKPAALTAAQKKADAKARGIQAKRLKVKRKQARLAKIAKTPKALKSGLLYDVINLVEYMKKADLEKLTTKVIRDLLAFNNKLTKRAVEWLRKQGIATPPDIMQRCI